MHTIINAIINRSSKRAFLSKPVPKEIQEKILHAAAMSPSGANMQPWITYAISNEEVLKNIGDAIIQKMNSGIENDQFIQYYPLEWKSVYKKRRIETGIGLYSLMGVDRKDIETRTKMWHDNFRWFGAQTVFFVFTDKSMIDNAQGALIDCGAYMQSIMLAALEFGIDSCPQGSTTEFGKVVADVLDAPKNLALLYSVVIGYEDKEAKINTYRPKRAAISENVVFI
ncbi:MAG: nitroreductase [Sulfurimonas sp. RIFOXYD12_FULL_33_39]|uniref:nitroreductase n=1 Tax=unclassified Sulfurimonas TaxID=2623549 RepID=UPI0008CC2159|nr:MULTISPECIES: nitroreductase [unclassified Sulfurimonas]OHE04020.1 MAG: nitroreductase [Sulfurimonas sp. RIFCSPLOWO2_12_FULL_34_6]OHE08749.1 MAG: nitroreductase [Sulfurimonas sp. RIFOXYD12_FULL_33_39]OHE14034.1 MAG: nitroreductase [Sulfurimonas sp. RIFOXYD2_FULL_34_21]DAB27640.1 MAG TPA: nitroreductase [Sulfurimonas sp. UBA10385]